MIRVVGPAALLFVALISTVIALHVAGGVADQLISNVSATVKYGLPLSKLLVNIAAAATIGALALATFALGERKGELNVAADIAAASAAVWAVASAATGFFTFLFIYQPTVTLDDRFGQSLGIYLTETDNGSAWLQTTLVAAAITVVCFATRNRSVLLAVTVVAVLGLIPMADLGHTGGTETHDAATAANWLHMVFACIWLGGLVTLALLARSLDSARLETVVGRYSSLALVSFIVVAASGYAGAEIRVGSLDNMFSPYGALIVVKIVALLALGAFGALQRTIFIRRMSAPTPTARRNFWWLIAAELAFMGLASGTAAALARSATPVREEPLPDSSPANLLTGAPLPPPMTVERLFTTWNFDLIWLLVCAFAAFFYLAGVWRLRKRGDSWSMLRTVSWLAGLALLFYITNGGINVYEKYVFSAHMFAHMVLGMMVPVLLVPGAPITLALRAVAKRTDDSRGVREWLLLIVHSRYFSVLANPIVAGALFAASLWIFYYSPLFRWATTEHVGHQWMIIHFLATGYLFVQSLIGIDPVPNRPPFPMRLAVLFATMAFHAFFGLSLMTGSGLLLADWYGAMGWGTDALADQRTAGGIAWSVGEVPTVILAITVAILWARSDARESKRYDRKADRDGDAELGAYNEMLAGRAARSVPATSAAQPGPDPTTQSSSTVNDSPDTRTR